MNADIKSKWLEALRSGKYRQGRRRLRTEDGYYCGLGVLCDIAGAKWEYSNGRWVAVHKGNRSYERLPHSLRDELGIVDRDSLAVEAMNDGSSSWLNDPQTLEQIADWIEANI